MSKRAMPPVGGYVLAGGQSSRMGTEKALVQLAGKPLVEHAVTKLGRLCQTVRICSGNPLLGHYAPLVADEFPGCGPLGGVAAALMDSEFAWNLILPVDVPFVSTRLLDGWLWSMLRQPIGDRRLSMLCVDAQAHPTLLIVHRDVTPYLRSALKKGSYRLRLALVGAAEAIALERRVKVERVFWQAQWDEPRSPRGRNADKAWERSPQAGVSRGVRPDEQDMFTNLNTPEELARAEGFAHLLDTL